jgi:endoglucanase
MKYLKLCLIPLAVLLSALSSCGGKEDPVTPTPPTPKAPTAITLSVSSISAKAEGESFEITVKAPFIPQVDNPSWITVKNGTMKDYTVVQTLEVAANTAYESRTATLTFKATGATSATLTVTQEAAVEPEPPTPGEEGLASFFGLGWNLGNQFDGYYNGSWAGEKEGYPDETCWMPEPQASYKATQATFDGLKAKGFCSVRIPVSWLKMIGDAPEYKINEAWINRVYEVVGYAHTAGLKVIINTHHDENHGVNNTYQWLDIKNAANNAELNNQIKEKIKGAWTNIANKFKDCEDDWLLMEGFNELNDGGWGWSEDFRKNPQKQCNILNEWNQVFVDAVRATGGYNATRWLGVPSYCANPDFTKYMTIPNDPAKKVAVSVHCYDPSAFALGETVDGKRVFNYSDWGHTGDPSKKVSGSDEDYIKNKFATLYNNYVAKGIPVYVGEFGCCLRTDSRSKAFIKYYLEYVVKAAKTYSLPCFLWDNSVQGGDGENHGYIHHGNGNYLGGSKEFVDVITRGWNKEDKAYTLDYVYSTAPKM